MDRMAPRDEADVAEIVGAATTNECPLELVGGGSRRDLGRPSSARAVVSTKSLNGITLYEPSELVLSAQAGTPLKSIAELLDQHGQELAFEPIDHARILGGAAGTGTVGGMIAVNASGPRRIRSGAARDYLLGFRAISGRGELFKSGGRVMKNVTGYDMSKLMTGSYGTLGVLTEVTLKVLPKPETESTVLVTGLDDAAAVHLMTRVSGLSLEVSCFAHIPLAMPRQVPALNGHLSQTPVTCFRVEGPKISVDERCAALRKSMGDAAAKVEVIEGAVSRALWLAVRDVVDILGPDGVIWRVSTAPAEGARLVAALQSRGLPMTGYFYDWAGGLIWLALKPAQDASAAEIRKEVDKHGGHATLIRAGASVRSSVPVFHPQPPALAALSSRIRRSFDPALILNRGRMREDL